MRLRDADVSGSYGVSAPVQHWSLQSQVRCNLKQNAVMSRHKRATRLTQSLFHKHVFLRS